MNAVVSSLPLIEVFNYRLVQDYWLSKNPRYQAWLEGLDRESLRGFLDTVPIPPEVCSRLAWENYLT